MANVKMYKKTRAYGPLVRKQFTLVFSLFVKISCIRRRTHVTRESKLLFTYSIGMFTYSIGNLETIVLPAVLLAFYFD